MSLDSFVTTLGPPSNEAPTNLNFLYPDPVRINELNHSINWRNFSDMFFPALRAFCDSSLKVCCPISHSFIPNFLWAVCFLPPLQSGALNIPLSWRVFVTRSGALSVAMDTHQVLTLSLSHPSRPSPSHGTSSSSLWPTGLFLSFYRPPTFPSSTFATKPASPAQTFTSPWAHAHYWDHVRAPSAEPSRRSVYF